MKRLACAVCVAISSYVLCVGVKFMCPFLAFAIGEKLQGNHDTLVCQAHKACNVSRRHFTLTEDQVERHAVFSPDLSPAEVNRIHDLWRHRFRAKSRRDGGPLFVHVGPADLGGDDFTMYSRIAPHMDGGRIVFVEPHPGQQERLRERLSEIDNASSVSMSILAAAACPEAGDGIVFYKISDRFFADFNDYAFYIRYWASLNKQHLIDETQFFNSNQKVWLFKALKIFPESFPETVEEWSRYVDEVRVRCLSPVSLLAEIGAKPSDIDVLILDSEGYDAELMRAFLAFDGFAPSTVMFEWHLHANDPAKMDSLVGLVSELHARGYDVHRHNHDVLAMAAQRSTDGP